MTARPRRPGLEGADAEHGPLDDEPHGAQGHGAPDATHGDARSAADPHESPMATSPVPLIVLAVMSVVAGLHQRARSSTCSSRTSR